VQVSGANNGLHFSISDKPSAAQPGVYYKEDPRSVGWLVGSFLRLQYMDPFLPIQFRVDRTEHDVLVHAETLSRAAATVFMFQHPKEGKCKRIHTHGYLFETNVIRETFRDRLKKAFSLDKEVYETSNYCGKNDRRPLDISGAWCYGSKFATIAPFYLKNISPVQVEQLNEYARTMRKTYSDKSSPALGPIVYVKETPKTKPTQYQNAKNIYEHLFDTYIHKSGELDNKPKDFDEIPNLSQVVFNATFQYLRTNKIFCGRYKMIEYAEAVMLMTGTEDYRNSCYKGFEKRFI